MAKTTKSKSPSTASSNSSSDSKNPVKLSSIIDNISKKSRVIIENDKKTQEFISTGIYVLDAAISKSVTNGGIPRGKITLLAGPKAVGKTFIAMNAVRNAQKAGDNIIWIDTESAVLLSDFEMYGVDTSDQDAFKLIKSSSVEDIKVFLAQLLDQLKQLKEKGVDTSKNFFVIDSIGALGSSKEIEDAIKGDVKTDMTRAKALNSLWRIIQSDLGYLGCTMLATNHIYLTMDLFPDTKMKGGEGGYFAASVIVFLSDAKLKTGDESGDEMSLGYSGSVVTAKTRKNRLAKPKKVKFEISHETGINPFRGLELFCTPENFEKVGIAKVKPEADKKTGEITYVSSSQKYYVRHLDKSYFEKQLFNSKVFTMDVLKSMDSVVYDYFRYPSFEEFQTEISNFEAEIVEEIGDDNFEISELSDEQLIS